MLGLLIVLGLLVAVIWIFLSAFRSRVRRNLGNADLGAELAALKSARPLPRPASVAAAPAAVASVRAPVAPALHYLLIYDVGPDFVEKRAAVRNEHLALAWKAAAAGELLLAGALEEPTEQAFLLFRGSREAAQRFAQADPYVRHGLVKQWRVKQWHTVAGEGAAMPVRPPPPRA